MKTEFDAILAKKIFSKDDIVALLSTTDENDVGKLFEKSCSVKKEYVGSEVYLRGLLEFSNVCRKNCFYCGIRSDNKQIHRYSIPDEEIKEIVLHAWKNNYGSMVFQSGERNDAVFIEHVIDILKYSKKITNNEIGITLSCGEQSEKTYQKLFDSGAHRYLLRIETSNEALYYKIHPENETHSFKARIEALRNLKKTGFQTGTGIMIGLPFQTIEDLADDLLFFKKNDIDMVGMGPYIEHKETPMYKYRKLLMPKTERFNLTLRMIAVLRIMMKDINIAASTALQAIDNEGRVKGLKAGANVIMPNLTPSAYIEDYFLYDNKPCLHENIGKYFKLLESSIHDAGDTIAYKKWGDSKHFFTRTSAR
ncbi:MAG: [FeFe] hydrogenase H-cluster radical SAM maturase HydE [Bacteroidetes bacterium]|nr:[FeFe] hydrogenase H-cluster radical SAM maturase HydE [Bacteroidota bacterium]